MSESKGQGGKDYPRGSAEEHRQRQLCDLLKQQNETLRKTVGNL